MIQPFCLFRGSNGTKELDAKYVDGARAAIDVARRVLADNPCPNTFLGRKTQEPFPKEPDYDRKA